MAVNAIAVVAGAWSVHGLASLPPAWGPWLVLAALAPCLRWRAAWPVAAFAAGFALAVTAADARLSPGLAPTLAGADLRIEGRVTGLPRHDERRDRFRLAVERAWLDGRPVTVPETVRLGWYDPQRPRVAAGDRWRLTVRLKAPRGLRNPGGFDYAGWLFREGIGATGYVRPEPGPLALAPAVAPLDRTRAALRDAIAAHAADLPHLGVLLALTVGDRASIGSDAWDTLIATGTNHLVAISGLHVGLLALAGFGLGRLAWRACGPLRVHLPRPMVQAASAMALATLYAGLSGFALPTQRALVMLATALAAILLRRRTRPGTALATAAVAVILFDPLAPGSPGFWLSFGAVGAIVLVSSGRLGRPRRIPGWLRLQLGISLALAPLLFVLFGAVSLVSPAANLLAVPWVSIGVVPPALAGAVLAPVWPDASAAALAAASHVFAPLWWVLEQGAALPFAQWRRPLPPVWLAAPALLGALLWLAPRGVPGRAAGLLAVAPLLVWTPARPAPGALWLDVLDVGQGLAVVVRTHRHTLVYDTGPRFSAGFDAGAAAVVPFLRQAGTRGLDMLVVSHGDNDHAGGAASVRAAYPPTRVRAGEPEALGAGAVACVAGEAWTWDRVRFRFLHPGPAARPAGNDGSCVLRIEAPGGRVLLPGDIEAPVERDLVAAAAPLDVDVVVAPHHGSESSSTAGFVARVEPSWVLYSIGHGNRWGFPAPSVMRRWAAAGFARTDCGGALHVRVTPEGGVAPPVAWRGAADRFWHAGCGGNGKSGNMRAVARP